MFLCACGSGSIGKFSLNINNNCTLLEPGEPLTTPDTPPAPEGMSFAGWTWTVRGETLDSMPATMPQADVIGMPIWVPNSYTLTIDGTSSQVAYGTTLTPPASPTAKGKSFTGWTWTVGGKTVDAMPKTMPAADVTAVANWKTNSYTLTINGTSTTVAYGTTLTAPAALTAPEGKSFSWIWTVGGKKVDAMPKTMPAADVTAVANWTVNTYTLTINGTSSQVDYGTALAAPAAPTAPEGKSFGGWTWTVGGKTVSSMPKTMPAADVTAAANWKTNSYTLTINGTSKQVAYGTALTAPLALADSENSAFGGWIWTVDGKKVDAMPATMPAADVTATPNWLLKSHDFDVIPIVETYTLTINGESKQVAYGTHLLIPARPTAEGKTFIGWTWTVGGKKVATMPKTMPAANVTATANWRTNSYTLTINGESKQVAYGTTLTAPADPTAEGKTFTGWTWTVDGKTVASMPATMPAATVTATPNWTVNSYTLTINGESKQVVYGTTLTVPAAPTAEGKTFTGWTWTVGGKTVASMPATMPAANVTAAANWTTNSYTLTINGESKQVAYGATLTAPAAPTAEGKTFTGWTWTVGNTTVDAMPKTMPAAAVTAVANWTVNTYTLTINGESKQVVYGTTLTAPAAPTAEGKTFTGWTWTVGGKTVDAMPKTMPAANVTTVANWTVNTYTLTINGESKQVDYGTALTAPAAPTSEGKTFTGWTWTVGGKTVDTMPTTMPAADVTATANWKVNSYKLTINGKEETVPYGTALSTPTTPTAPEGHSFFYWKWTVDGVEAAKPETMPAADVTAEPIWMENNYCLTIDNVPSWIAFGSVLSTPAAPTAPEGHSFNGWTWKVGDTTVDAMPTTMPAADVTATANWKVNSYKLTINGQEETVPYGTTLGTPVDPTAPKGHSFGGWKWIVGNVEAAKPAAMPAADVTVVPIWKVNTYTLTINNVSKQIDYGTALSTPTAPAAPKGHSFNGWTWTVDGVTVSAMPTTMPDATVTATANWKVNSYKLTINGEEETVLYGTALSTPTTPTAPEGYRFDGWKWKVGDNETTMPATMPDANVSANPIWIVNTYSLTINGVSSWIDYGTPLTAPAAPTAEGKTFTGWTWTVGSTTVDAMPKTMPAAAVTAVANWTTNSYTLTINGTSTQVAYGTALTAPADPTPATGYSFDHWEWSFGGITQNTMPATMPAADVTAKPIWKQIDYSMIFYDGYGKTLSEETYHYGDTIVYPANPTYKGKIFNGWNFSVGEKLITMPAQNVTATAAWSDEEIVPPDDAVQYTVSFQWPNDGYVEYQLNEGDPIPYNQITLPEGYKWDWTDKWIMPAHNLAISAVPIENPDAVS